MSTLVYVLLLLGMISDPAPTVVVPTGGGIPTTDPGDQGSGGG